MKNVFATLTLVACCAASPAATPDRAERAVAVAPAPAIRQAALPVAGAVSEPGLAALVTVGLLLAFLGLGRKTRTERFH